MEIFQKSFPVVVADVAEDVVLVVVVLENI
jgi:hypothetical protein